MVDKADVVARVCGALREGDRDRAASLATDEYPFVATTNAGRAYTALQSTRIFRRGGFLDRYTGDRLVFPGTIPGASKLEDERCPHGLLGIIPHDRSRRTGRSRWRRYGGELGDHVDGPECGKVELDARGARLDAEAD
jgi:hypothetical protein